MRCSHRLCTTGLPDFLADAEDVARGVRDERRVADRREVDEPYAVRIHVEHVRGDLQRQPRLAEAAHAEQREQARAFEESLRVGELGFAPDERRSLLRQVVGRRLERAQRGKVLPELRVQELIDVLARREVAQPHRAQVAQRHRVRQALADAIDHRLRKEDLAAVRGLHDSRGAVDGAAEEIVVAPLDEAEVQSRAYPKRDRARRRRHVERALQRYRRRERVDRIGERRVHAVAGHLDDDAVILVDGRARQAIVLGERAGHGLALPFPQARAALDVGEEQRRQLR